MVADRNMSGSNNKKNLSLEDMTNKEYYGNTIQQSFAKIPLVLDTTIFRLCGVL